MAERRVVRRLRGGGAVTLLVLPPLLVTSLVLIDSDDLFWQLGPAVLAVVAMYPQGLVLAGFRDARPDYLRDDPFVPYSAAVSRHVSEEHGLSYAVVRGLVLLSCATPVGVLLAAVARGAWHGLVG